MAYNEKAEVLLRLQRYDEAERTLLASQQATGIVRDVVAQQSAKVSTTLLLGNVYSSQGRHQDAISVFRRAAETVPWQQLPKVFCLPFKSKMLCSKSTRLNAYQISEVTETYHLSL